MRDSSAWLSGCPSMHEYLLSSVGDNLVIVPYNSLLIRSPGRTPFRGGSHTGSDACYCYIQSWVPPTDRLNDGDLH